MSTDRDNRAREGADSRVRIDQWLWAARFYKTRALAAEAIGAGRVDVNGERVKRSRAVRIDDEVTIRMPPFQHVVMVRGVSARRGPASDAQRLYDETPGSREARERMAWHLRHAAVRTDFATGKPNKKERREWEKMRGRE